MTTIKYVASAPTRRSHPSRALFERFINYDRVCSSCTSAISPAPCTSYPQLVSRNASHRTTPSCPLPSTVNELRLGYNRVVRLPDRRSASNRFRATNWVSTMRRLSPTSAAVVTDTTPSLAGPRDQQSPATPPSRRRRQLTQGDPPRMFTTLGDSSQLTCIGKNTLQVRASQFQWRQIAQKADNNGRGSFTFNSTCSGSTTNNSLGIPLVCNGIRLHRYPELLPRILHRLQRRLRHAHGVTTRDNTYGALRQRCLADRPRPHA